MLNRDYHPFMHIQNYKKDTLHFNIAATGDFGKQSLLNGSIFIFIVLAFLDLFVFHLSDFGRTNELQKQPNKA